MFSKRMYSKPKLKLLVFELSLLSLFPCISTGISFDPNQSVTLVPYPTTPKTFSVSLENSTLGEDESKNGTETNENFYSEPSSSQKRLDIVKTKPNRAFAEAKSVFSKINFTLPTLQKLAAGLSWRKSSHKSQKRNQKRNSYFNFFGNSKDYAVSEENLSEPRNYNHDQVYPVYNYAAPTTGSDDAEDSAYVPNFGMVKEVWPGYPGQENPTFPPLTTTYSPKIVAQPLQADYTFGDWKPHAARYRKPYSMNEPPVYVDYLDDTRVVNVDNMGRYWPQGPPPIIHVKARFHRYRDDEGHVEYQPYHEHSEGHGIDFSKVGMFLLLKIGLAKLKFFVLMKLAFFMLLKLKLILMALFLKFLLFIKGVKMLKLLFLPLLLAALAPALTLLLLPLLTLPSLFTMLIQMLLDRIQVPVVVPDEDMGGGGDMTRREDTDIGRKLLAPDDGFQQVKMILFTDDCLKKMACEVASRTKPSLRSLLITWTLEALMDVAPHQKVKDYMEAYKLGLYRDPTESWCSKNYRCKQSKNDSSKLTANM